MSKYVVKIVAEQWEKDMSAGTGVLKTFLVGGTNEKNFSISNIFPVIKDTDKNIKEVINYMLCIDKVCNRVSQAQKYFEFAKSDINQDLINYYKCKVVPNITQILRVEIESKATSIDVYQRD